MGEFKVNSTVGPMPTGGGVTLVFENGASLSIQSKPGDMCTPGTNVEVMAWGPGHEKIKVDGVRDCKGWVPVDDLGRIINKVKNWSK